MWCCFGEHRDGQEAEEGFFLENGGRVLEELVTTFNGKYNPFRIFSKRELSAATNKYHSGGILHKGFTYILYEGTHEDRPISVKKFAESSARDYIECFGAVLFEILTGKSAMILHMMFVPDENESGTMISNLEEIEKEAESST
ncbi:Non-functional pseudokinase ZED1 [Vitis vinifera]|uniref:Non-functional pseudokinase ZED1 n=1 Tax=Vitis vinifera TaxID=29760 RepID=A0A438ETZ2_VITVI|nr:Non-functional pseudokinase ZED1 [Vitis vinifera]